MEVVSNQMTQILKDSTKQTSQSKRAHSAGDVEHIMMLQGVGLKMPIVILVIKRVTYPHDVKVSKISEKPKPRKVKAQERAKANEKVKVIAKQIRQTIVMHVNSVGSITRVVNRVENRTQPSQRLRRKWP